MTNKEIIVSSNSDVADMSSEDFAEMMGYTRDRRDMPFPRMTINSDAEDDDRNALPPGSYAPTSDRVGARANPVFPCGKTLWGVHPLLGRRRSPFNTPFPIPPHTSPYRCIPGKGARVDGMDGNEPTWFGVEDEWWYDRAWFLWTSWGVPIESVDRIINFEFCWRRLIRPWSR